MTRLKEMTQALLRLLEVVVIIAIVGGILYIPFTYGKNIGTIIGSSDGYIECKSETVFPSLSELEKVQNKMQEVLQ